MRSRLATYLVLFTAWVFSSAVFGQSTPIPTSSASSQVTTCPVYIPKAFTPNGDNLNDLFTVKFSENCELVKYDIKIFDRWGRIVFSSNSAKEQDSWNGMVDGSLVRAGVYMYKISTQMRNLNEPEFLIPQNLQGSIVLIR